MMIIVTIKRKQVVENPIAHHQLTNAKHPHPEPRQMPYVPISAPQFMYWHDAL